MTSADLSMSVVSPAERLSDAEFFHIATECPVEAWLAFLGHRWNALIIYHLGQGAKRFNEISACLPTATPKVLAERINALERYRLIDRPSGARGEPYSLTSKGATLLTLLDQLELWTRDFPKADFSR